jgi:hypothetical protein
MNRIELMMRRKAARAFIMADPIRVQFKRTTRTKTPAGGWADTELPPLPPQVVRIDPGKRRFGESNVNTEAGSIVLWPYIMLGFHTLDVQVGDNFEWTGYTGVNNHFEVKSIEEMRRDEITMCWIDFYGGE